MLANIFDDFRWKIWVVLGQSENIFLILLIYAFLITQAGRKSGWNLILYIFFLSDTAWQDPVQHVVFLFN